MPHHGSKHGRGRRKAAGFRHSCLTEPRIVDALFDRCGAFIIEEQDIASPQCRRLISRDRRFAMLEHSRMDTLADGDHIAFESHRTTVLPRRR